MFRLATQFWPIGAALNSIVAILGRVKLTAQPCEEGGEAGKKSGEKCTRKQFDY